MSQQELMTRLLASLAPDVALMHMVCPPPELVRSDVVRWRSFDASPTDHYVRVLESAYLQTNRKRDSSSDDEYCNMLLSVKPSDLDLTSASRPITVIATDALAAQGFGRACVIHPSVARAFVTRNADFMVPNTYTVWPCHLSEFVGDESPEEGAFRKRYVPLNRLNREPHPGLRMRFRAARARSAGGGKRWNNFEFSDVASVVDRIHRESGFCEVENFERATVEVVCDPQCEVRMGLDRWHPSKEELQSWIRVFCVEGAEAAEQARKEG